MYVLKMFLNVLKLSERIKTLQPIVPAGKNPAQSATTNCVPFSFLGGLLRRL